MRKSAGLWIAVGGGSLADTVAGSIQNQGYFTTTVPESEVKPRSAELVVVSMHGTGADYVGICQAGRRVATGLTTVLISNLVQFKRLSKDLFLAKLAAGFASRFDPPSEGAYRPTPKLWEQVLALISDERPAVKATMSDFRRIIAGAQPRRRAEGGLEVFERDAVASALQAWGGTSLRKRVLRNAVPSGQSSVAPFLSQIKGVSVREDLQIGQDHEVFPGMKVARRDIVGSVVLSDGKEYLTILNCNRQPLERTLGVDLIYYSHRFDSFILVQYKRMTQGKGGWPEYRPESVATLEHADASFASSPPPLASAEPTLLLKSPPLLAARAPVGDRHSLHSHRLERFLVPLGIKTCIGSCQVRYAPEPAPMLLYGRDE
jgi:hypothetical protein